MTREISLSELPGDAGEIVRGLDRGDSFVLLRDGQPVGEVVPLRRRRFVATESALALFRGAPGTDCATLRADLDAVSDSGGTPRS